MNNHEFYVEHPKPTPEERLFSAFRKNDKEEIAQLRNEYEEKFKGQIEGVIALFELQSFLENRKKLEDMTLEREKRNEAIMGCTEYQYLLSHFVLQNGQNEKFLGRFWETLAGLAKEMGNEKSADPLRHGVLSQVATYKIFEKLGMQPGLSTPKKDAFNAIDLVVEGEDAVQVKGSPYTTATILETDNVSFPGVAVQKEGVTEYYSGFLFDNIQKFKAKVSKYEKEVGHSVKGYLVVVPYSEFNPATGEPSEKIVELARENLGKRDSAKKDTE